jgi:hypothetical protein
MMRATSGVAVALVVARWTGRTASSLVRAGAVSHLDGMQPTGAASRGWSLMAGDGHGGPARGYSWQPFQPGHTLSLRHGAWSKRSVAPLAERIAADLASAAPWTRSPAFASTIASWSWAEAQATLLRAWLDAHGHLDDEGVPRPATLMLDRVESRAAKLRSELGLSPISLGSLMTKAATVASALHDTDVLEALRAEGARLLAARTDDTTDGAAALTARPGGSSE